MPLRLLLLLAGVDGSQRANERLEEGELVSHSRSSIATRHLQAFVEDCRCMFDRMREAHETESDAYDNGAEAMVKTVFC